MQTKPSKPSKQINTETMDGATEAMLALRDMWQRYCELAARQPTSDAKSPAEPVAKLRKKPGPKPGSKPGKKKIGRPRKDAQ